MVHPAGTAITTASIRAADFPIASRYADAGASLALVLGAGAGTAVTAAIGIGAALEAGAIGGAVLDASDAGFIAIADAVAAFGGAYATISFTGGAGLIAIAGSIATDGATGAAVFGAEVAVFALFAEGVTAGDAANGSAIGVEAVGLAIVVVVQFIGAEEFTDDVIDLGAAAVEAGITHGTVITVAAWCLIGSSGNHALARQRITGICFAGFEAGLGADHLGAGLHLAGSGLACEFSIAGVVFNGGAICVAGALADHCTGADTCGADIAVGAGVTIAAGGTVVSGGEVAAVGFALSGVAEFLAHAGVGALTGLAGGGSAAGGVVGAAGGAIGGPSGLALHLAGDIDAGSYLTRKELARWQFAAQAGALWLCDALTVDADCSFAGPKFSIHEAIGVHDALGIHGPGFGGKVDGPRGIRHFRRRPAHRSGGSLVATGDQQD